MSAMNNYVRIARFLAQGRSLVWIRIIKRSGSAPRSIGADCLLLDDDTLVGSIGGGLMEYEVLETARRIRAQRLPRVIHFDLMGKDADAAGMICGGMVDVLIDPLFPDDPDIVALFDATKNCILSGIPGTFISLVTAAGGCPPEKAVRMLVGPEEKTLGDMPGGIPSLPELSNLDAPALLRCAETGRVFFAEPLKSTPVLLLFGAGHISSCLAPMAKMVGYRVIVIDDRAEYANADRFPDADEIYVMPFAQAVRQCPATDLTHAVIVTRGHSHDRLVLEAMLSRPHAYIGMIGSIKKRNAIYEALIQTGVSPETLSAVYSPIGLDIGAETPEEIAVSIIAELIDTRAQKRNSLKMAEET